jgi:hypothetical protein
MRATQMTPPLRFQNIREPNWMAHTPVGHDGFIVISIGHT